MRRRSASPTDSLELLLDTISNVFGAIILMAILVVISAQSTVIRIPKKTSPSVVEQRQLKFDEARLAALDREPDPLDSLVPWSRRNQPNDQT